jgi:hypothetical protein
LKHRLPNSFISQVFPTCRAPVRISGILSFLFFHSSKSSKISLSISIKTPLFTGIPHILTACSEEPYYGIIYILHKIRG